MANLHISACPSSPGFSWMMRGLAAKAVLGEY